MKIRVKQKQYEKICPRSKYRYWEKAKRDWREIQLGGVAEVDVPDVKKFFQENPQLEEAKGQKLTWLFEEATGKKKEGEIKDDT